MSENGSCQVSLISRQAPRRNVIHLGLGFQFREDSLLSATPIVEGHQFSCRQVLVAQNHFVFEVIFMRLEQIQLQNSLALLALQGTHENETTFLIPALRFPPPLKVTRLAIGSTPVLAFFDLVLQDRPS